MDMIEEKLAPSPVWLDQGVASTISGVLDDGSKVVYFRISDESNSLF
jgi:hypothetical protein